jgi:UPF0716 family protein affecting phage T7 exclusion
MGLALVCVVVASAVGVVVLLALMSAASAADELMARWEGEDDD